jgi:large subunit ribosomal protein L47
MRAIKHVLTERFYVWEDAVEEAKKDPEVNLAGDGPAFTPRDYLEEGDVEEAAGAAEAAEETTEKTEPATTPPSKAQAEAPRL